MDDRAALAITASEADRAFPAGAAMPGVAALWRWLHPYRWTLATAGVFALAAAVRARHVLAGGGFPLNDGGLFFAMSRDVQSAGYTLPATTSYNGDGLPFAYPPLGLYVAAVVEDVTPLSMLDLYWLLPLLGAVLAVGAFHLLARALFDGRAIPSIATAGFALAPRAFEWLIMGGGMTRSFGMAAALAAAAAYYVALRGRDARRLALAAVLAALTLATHLEAALFLAVGVGLMTAQRPRRWSAGAAAAVGLATVALTAPWWGSVLAQHGPAPFLDATEHGGNLLADGDVPQHAWHRLIAPVFTSEPFFSVVGALGALGAIVALSRGRWLLAAWWAAVLLLQFRAFATFSVVPTALLAGYAAAEVVGPALRASLRNAEGAPVARARVALVVGGIAAVACYGAVDADRGEAQYLRPVADADLAAMRWIATAAPADARFAVIPVRDWYADREGEWFPAIAQRESVATPQGYEWRAGEFDRRIGLHRGARACASGATGCLDRLLEDQFTHVFLPADCCSTLRTALLRDNRYRVLFDDRALVVERVR